MSGTLNGAGSSAQEAAQGAWTAGFQQANTGATVNYDPSGSGAGVEQFLAGAVNFAGSDAYLDDTQLADSKKPCAGQTALEVPDLHQPDRDGLQPRRGRQAAAVPRHRREDLRGQDHQVGRPGDQGRQPGRQAARRQTITAGAPLGRLGHHQELHRLPAPDRRPAPGPPTPAETWPFKSGEGANGTSGVIEAVTNGKGTIGYADASQAGNLGTASIKVGSSLRRPDRRRPPPRPPTSPSASPAAPPTTSPSTSTAPRPSPAPTRWCWSPT